jgi:hypothetical protein
MRFATSGDSVQAFINPDARQQVVLPIEDDWQQLARLFVGESSQFEA